MFLWIYLDKPAHLVTYQKADAPFVLEDYSVKNHLMEVVRTLKKCEAVKENIRLVDFAKSDKAVE